MIWSIIWYVGILCAILKLIRWVLIKWRGTLDRKNEINVKGKIVIVTGASSGIGLATATELASRDANVIMACRDLDKTKIAIKNIRDKTSRGQLIVLKLDLGSLESVRDFAKEFNSKYDRLDILINNAGVMTSSSKRFFTKDGFEMHFGVNHLGHFLLTNLLLEPLKKASPSRIVTVSSMAHSWGSIDLDNLMSESKIPESNPRFLVSKLYSNSKLANALFNKELGARLEGTGVRTYALCPGMVFTEIGRDLDVPFFMHLLRPLMWYLLRSPEEGAWTTLYCALSKNLAHETGQMYQNCRFWNPKYRIELKDEEAKTLWRVSERLVGLST